jgi:hypothetical protein
MRVPRLASLAVTVVLALLMLTLLPAMMASGQATGQPAGGARGLVSAERIITTLYAYPGLSLWNQVTGNAPAVGASIVDMCAADGSGSGYDGTPWKERPPTAWTIQLQALQNAGIIPLVYIATGYGDAGGTPAFSLATVEAEVSEAVAWYGSGIGFMFDQSATSYALESSYYGPLFYLPASDILGVFAGPQARFRTKRFPYWLARYPSSRFAAAISAGTAAGVASDVATAARDGIGNVYVGDEPEPPGHATLPAFWPAEIAAVRQETAPAPSSGRARPVRQPTGRSAGR